jgi:hypothetical protein
VSHYTLTRDSLDSASWVGMCIIYIYIYIYIYVYVTLETRALLLALCAARAWLQRCTRITKGATKNEDLCGEFILSGRWSSIVSAYR